MTDPPRPYAPSAAHPPTPSQTTGDRADQRLLLLGAGASVEAGVPSSYELTRRIADQVMTGESRNNGTGQALHIAIGAMIAHDTARGAQAYAGIDVERLFSAIQMLAQRDDLEVTPFVSAWNPALEAAGMTPRFPTRFKESFEHELVSGLSSYNFERVFRAGVEAVTGGSWSQVFRHLEGAMIKALREALRVDVSVLDYLTPVFKAGVPARIATLNYDTTVEQLGRSLGLTVDTGIDHWTLSGSWRWSPSAEVRLLKLHGSINWWQSNNETGVKLPESRIDVSEEPPSVVGTSLAVVFGQREKLRSEGPFLDMLREFDAMLAESAELLIVGYSFRDNHINAAIRRWIKRTSDARIIIVDPALTDLNPYERNRPDFLRQLLLLIVGESHRLNDVWRPIGDHQVLSVKASEALKLLLG